MCSRMPRQRLFLRAQSISRLMLMHVLTAEHVQMPVQPKLFTQLNKLHTDRIERSCSNYATASFFVFFQQLPRLLSLPSAVCGWQGFQRAASLFIFAFILKLQFLRDQTLEDRLEFQDLLIIVLMWIFYDLFCHNSSLSGGISTISPSRSFVRLSVEPGAVRASFGSARGLRGAGVHASSVLLYS